MLVQLKKEIVQKKKYIFWLPLAQNQLVCDLLSVDCPLLNFSLNPGYCIREKSEKGEPFDFLKHKPHLTPHFRVNGFCQSLPRQVNTAFMVTNSPTQGALHLPPNHLHSHLLVKISILHFVLSSSRHQEESNLIIHTLVWMQWPSTFADIFEFFSNMKIMGEGETKERNSF